MSSGDSVAVIGGGIVGLVVARRLLQVRPGADVVVFEKEGDVGRHQTSHNSGVVHAGIYYAPGSLKASLCASGRERMRSYCQQHSIPYRELGKVVVATAPGELAALRALYDRARANRVPDVQLIDQARLTELEPSVSGIGAIYSPRTAVTDFAAVAHRMAEDVRSDGGTVRLDSEVTSVTAGREGVRVQTRDGSWTFSTVIACAGLGTDKLSGGRALDDAFRTVGFRGNYFLLEKPVSDHVRGLVYPVPDPRYPFLGIHLTRMWNDDVLVGPSAVLALPRAGGSRHAVAVGELRDLLMFPGFWSMAREHWQTGVREMTIAASKRMFLRDARRYLPCLRAEDLRPHPAGTRAQALRRDGALVDDFVVDSVGGLTVVRNAPSPAATSSLAIADYVVERLP